MKKIYLLLVLLTSIYSSQAQTSLDEINQTRCQHSLNGMIAFSSWTGANLIAGTVGVLTTTGETQHFFEMNLYFNAVNLGLAIPGLIGAVKAKRTGLSFKQSVKEMQKVKTVYLVNGVLDLTYITAGFLLREMSFNHSNDIQLKNRLAGYGNSLIVQGGFLLIYDFIKFGVHAINGKRLEEHWDKISVRPYGAYGLGMSFQYNLSHISPPDSPLSFSSF